MQLSIEAIIILVIAIVLLGLGIAFIKNFFAKGSAGLEGAFDPIAEHCDVSADNPVVPREIRLTQGERRQVKICVYNDQAAKIPSAYFAFKECIKPAGATGPAAPLPVSGNYPVSSVGDITLTSAGQDLARGQSYGYKTTVAISETAILGTYICNVEIICRAGTPGCRPQPLNNEPSTPRISAQMAITVS
jgi:hypothetical protein